LCLRSTPPDCIIEILLANDNVQSFRLLSDCVQQS
jgi:hypothetical protein